MAVDSRDRPRILVVAGHYLPGHKAGGPIRSVRNIVAALGDEFDFRILTSDRDFGDASPYATVAVDRWNRVEGAMVFYAGRRRWRLGAFARLVDAVDPHVVYLNSFFSPYFSLAPLLGRRCGRVAPHAGWIIAPRGELSAGALAIKPVRKRACMLAATAIGLHAGLVWQATSDREAADIREHAGVPDRAVHSAPNLTDAVGPFEPPAVLALPPAPLRICFLSRITQKKNLRFAIDVLAGVDRPVELHVYGPAEDARYAAECRSRAEAAGPSLRTFWHGDVPHEKVRSILARHHLFFLPTLGENFGHVIFEALAAGVPVLISDRTPWRAVEAAGAGWALPLAAQAAFVDVVRRLADSTLDDRAGAARRAHAHAEDFWRRSDGVAASRDLFRAAVAAGRR